MMSTALPQAAVEAAFEAVMRQRRGLHPSMEWPPLVLEEQWEIRAALIAALPHLRP